MSTSLLAEESPYAGYFVSLILLVLTAVVVVALRFFVKWRFARNIGPEDWFSVAALACAIVMTALMCRESYYALKFNGYEKLSRLVRGLKSMYINMIFYQLSLFLTKVSFLLQYLCIFPTKKMRAAIWTVLGMVIVYGGWTVFSMVFFCTPINAYWKQELVDGDRCFDASLIWLINGCLNIFTDLLIIILPLPGLQALMLPRGQKLGLMFMFALGGFVCIASMLRILAIIYAPEGRYPNWGEQPLVIWTAIETNVAIICSCLPTLRTLATRLWKKIHTSKQIRSTFSYLSSKGKRSSGSSSSISDSSNSKEDEKDPGIIVCDTEISVDCGDDSSKLKDEKRPCTIVHSLTGSGWGSNQV